MTTAKERINITTDPEMEVAIKQAAQREGVPVATKAAELLRIGLALEEDLYFSKTATGREQTMKGSYLTHEKTWSI